MAQYLRLIEAAAAGRGSADWAKEVRAEVRPYPGLLFCLNPRGAAGQCRERRRQVAPLAWLHRQSGVAELASRGDVQASEASPSAAYHTICVRIQLPDRTESSREIFWVCAGSTEFVGWYGGGSGCLGQVADGHWNVQFPQ